MIHILTNTYKVFTPSFGHSASVIELDLGCGKGAFTLSLATEYPQRLILGADVMLGRLRRLNKKVDRFGYQNVELLRAENFELMGYQLPDNCLDRIHILCPDPWPKGRHRHRRLITTDFLTRVARVLKPGGILHLATDHKPYVASQERIMAQLCFFSKDHDTIADVEHLGTDFENQWESQGRNVPHLGYRLTDNCV